MTFCLDWCLLLLRFPVTSSRVFVCLFVLHFWLPEVPTTPSVLLSKLQLQFIVSEALCWPFMPALEIWMEDSIMANSCISYAWNPAGWYHDRWWSGSLASVDHGHTGLSVTELLNFVVLFTELIGMSSEFLPQSKFFTGAYRFIPLSLWWDLTNSPETLMHLS